LSFQVQLDHALATRGYTLDAAQRAASA